MRSVRSLVLMLAVSLVLSLAASPGIAGTGGFFGEFTPDGGAIDAAPAVPQLAAFLLFVAGGLVVGGALLRCRR